MSGPKISSSAALCRGLACLGISLLAACASQTSPPMTATQEAATYIARAKPSYAPPGPPEDPWGPYISEASKKFDVPESWVREVMRVESGGHEFRSSGVLITSPVGAMGLMQLMPKTYDEVRARYSLGDDAFDPHNNILAGTAYLREMYDAFGSPGMLAAYNGGPARLEDYLVHNRPLPAETRRYVAMIAPYIRGEWPQSRSPAEQFAVNQLPDYIPAGPRYAVHRVLVASHQRRGHESVRYAAAERRVHHHGSSAPIELAEAPEVRSPLHGAVRVASGSTSHGWHLIEPAMASDTVSHGLHHVRLAAATTHAGHATVYHVRASDAVAHRSVHTKHARS